MNERMDWFAEDPQAEALIERIVALEWTMFQAVKSEVPSPCQELPATFRRMRWMTHCVYSVDTLGFYLDDLQQADAAGRNPMVEKYARMENLIPPLSHHPAIELIVLNEVRWSEETARRYPPLFSSRPAFFANYMGCELETCSDRTLESMLQDVRRARAADVNLVEVRYTRLFRRLGYASLEEASQAFAARAAQAGETAESDPESKPNSPARGENNKE